MYFVVLVVPLWLCFFGLYVGPSLNCVVTRTRSPDRRTLPSTITETESDSPISRMFFAFPLSANTDARDTTRRFGTMPSAEISSSVSPSLK